MHLWLDEQFLNLFKSFSDQRNRKVISCLAKNFLFCSPFSQWVIEKCPSYKYKELVTKCVALSNEVVVP